MDMIVKCKDQHKCPQQGESSLSNGGEGLGRGALSGWAGPRPPHGQERDDGMRGRGPGSLALA